MKSCLVDHLAIPLHSGQRLGHYCLCRGCVQSGYGLEKIQGIKYVLLVVPAFLGHPIHVLAASRVRHHWADWAGAGILGLRGLLAAKQAIEAQPQQPGG